MMIWVRLAHHWGAPAAPLEVRQAHPRVRLLRGVRLAQGVRLLHPCYEPEGQEPWQDRSLKA